MENGNSNTYLQLLVQYRYQFRNLISDKIADTIHRQFYIHDNQTFLLVGSCTYGPGAGGVTKGSFSIHPGKMARRVARNTYNTVYSALAPHGIQ